MTHTASLLTPVRMSIEEYLSTSFRPDMELVGGELKQKPVVAPVHGTIQSLLSLWLGLRDEEWHIHCMVETRTQVTQDDVRLPDVAITVDGPLPKKVLSVPPLIAIEVLSASDTFIEMGKRADDFASTGTQNIWLIDPETNAAWVFVRGSWQKSADSRLCVENSPVYLDLDWLWRKLDRARGVAAVSSK